MDIDIKLIWIFAIGTFLAGLFYIEEIITQEELVDKYSTMKIILLVVINAIIGGVVMVTTYYALIQFAPDWHDYLKVGLSGATAMLGKDLIHLYYKAMKKKVGVNE